MEKRGFGKRGQVTIFIIVAVVVVIAIVAYFLLRGGVKNNIPPSMIPVYDYYISCAKSTASQGVALLGQQAGYIEKPDFVPGSAYMPFSSELDFFGQGVPYWMYVSGNNILREQVPTRQGMERQLDDYVSERLDLCDFSDFERMGFDVFIGEGSAKTKINDNNVNIEINNPVTIFYQDNSVILKNHKISIDTKLGRYHDLALKIYDHQKRNVFLENYAVDVMRLYAPVTGVELSCVPKIFVDEEIREDIVGGLSVNIPTIKLKGSYYEVSSPKRNYFVENVNFRVDENVNFMYSPSWPTRIEIHGDRVANPVGLQQGMGILGFCYVPYHLIYDINFPRSCSNL
jgi:hypothetical protein